MQLPSYMLCMVPLFCFHFSFMDIFFCFMHCLNAASFPLSHSSLPFISVLALPLQTLLGPCTVSPLYKPTIHHVHFLTLIYLILPCHLDLSKSLCYFWVHTLHTFAFELPKLSIVARSHCGSPWHPLPLKKPFKDLCLLSFQVYTCLYLSQA